MRKTAGKRAGADIVSVTFLQVMLAQLMSFISQIIANLVDSVSISRFLSPEHLSAFSFSSTLTSVVMMVFGFLMTGTSIYASTAVSDPGAERRDGIFTTALIAALALGAVITAAFLLGAETLARLSGVPQSLAPWTAEYVRGYAVGIVPYLLFGVIAPTLLLEGNRNGMIIAFSVMAATDILLDILNGTLLHLGLFGMGLATAISAYAALGAAVLMRRCRSRSANFRLCPSGFGTPTLRELFSYGYMYAVKQIMTTALIYIYNNYIVSRFDADMLSAYAASYAAISFAWCVGSAIGNAVSSMTGAYMKEGDAASVRRLMGAAARYSILINGALTIALVIFARPIMGLFYRERDGYFAVAVQGLRFISLSTVIRSVNMALKGSYQSRKLHAQNLLLSLLSTVVCEAAALAAFTPLVGCYGIWLSFPVGECLATMIMMVVTKLKTGRPFSWNTLLMLEDSDPAAREIAAAPRSLKELMAWTEIVRDFCRAEGGDKRTINALALAAEEIGGNVFEHGFSDGKGHVVDVLLRRTDGHWMLRFRDNCMSFNPVGYLEAHGDDPEHCGIRMIRAMASDISYSNAFGLNNMVIRVDDVGRAS